MASPDRHRADADDSPVDEVLFSKCWQTTAGRAAGRPPRCAARGWRRVTPAELEGLPRIPLPHEGNKDSLLRNSVVFGPQTKYWRPGWYYWSSSNCDDILRRVSLAGASLSKERRFIAHEETLARIRAAEARKTAKAEVKTATGSDGSSPSAPQQRKPQPPGPPVRPPILADITQTTLIEITPSVLMEQVQQSLTATLQRTGRLCNLTAEKVTDGSLELFAHKVVNDAKPFQLLRASANLWLDAWARAQQEAAKEVGPTTKEEKDGVGRNKAV